jgi:hypothetical protein
VCVYIYIYIYIYIRWSFLPSGDRQTQAEGKTCMVNRNVLSYNYIYMCVCVCVYSVGKCHIHFGANCLQIRCTDTRVHAYTYQHTYLCKQTYVHTAFESDVYIHIHAYTYKTKHCLQLRSTECTCSCIQTYILQEVVSDLPLDMHNQVRTSFLFSSLLSVRDVQNVPAQASVCRPCALV